jgi:hypothetical protein
VDVQTKTRRYEMRRSALLVLTVALALLVFAPIAAAKGDDGGFEDGGSHVRGADDRGFDDRGMDVRGTDDRGFDDRGRGTHVRAVDDAVANPTPSASTSASPDTSPSASPTASPDGTAAATPALPDTGGFLPALVLGPLAMILGGGLAALSIMRLR